MNEAARAERPLDFSLSTKGLAVTGFASDVGELDAFIERLTAIAECLRRTPTPETPHE